jgi:hypothetical protein
MTVGDQPPCQPDGSPWLTRRFDSEASTGQLLDCLVRLAPRSQMPPDGNGAYNEPAIGLSGVVATRQIPDGKVVVGGRSTRGAPRSSPCPPSAKPRPHPTLQCGSLLCQSGLPVTSADSCDLAELWHSPLQECRASCVSGWRVRQQGALAFRVTVRVIVGPSLGRRPL